MDTALYYTFSTIAQTLAGALAVLVAFALFRVARLDEAITRGQDELLRYSQWPMRWEALRIGGLEALEKDLGAPVTEPHLRIAYREASIAAGLRPRVLGALRIALGATVVDIGLCFIALPFTPILVRRPGLAGTTAGLAVALGLLCLVLYWRLIATMVKPAG